MLCWLTTAFSVLRERPILDYPEDILVFGEKSI